MKIATLAIIVRDGKVLLGYKKKGEIGAKTLNGPGGKVEPGETLLHCVVREAREELGIHLIPSTLNEIAVITFFASGEPDFKVHIFWTDKFRGRPKETSEMIPQWVSVSTLPLDQMLESDRKWFPKAIRGERFRATVHYKESASGFQKIEFTPY
ncbi:MAG: 8-oxo-dGTP diphosphatase [Candidatus Colwellbacteria bacterium]|nr:8-oxo-dGTP diphosphatase [Candidatus Colwellbacteria bacterium]